MMHSNRKRHLLSTCNVICLHAVKYAMCCAGDLAVMTLLNYCSRYGHPRLLSLTMHLVGISLSHVHPPGLLHNPAVKLLLSLHMYCWTEQVCSHGLAVTI